MTDLTANAFGESAERSPDTTGDAGIPAGPVILRMSDVRPTPLQWLWRGRIPLAKLSMLAGDPSLGKSLLTLDVAARVSKGMPWPDARSESNPVGSVLLLSAEDDPEDTIAPRLIAAGADLSRVHVLTSARDANGRLLPVNLADIDLLDTAVAKLGDARLLVVDPVSAFMGGTDSHKNADVRGLLGPLSALAQRRRVAVVAVSHLNKSYGGKSMYRMTGSLAFVAAARAAWLVVADPDDTEHKRRLMLSVKSNLGPAVGGLAYRVQAVDVDGLGPQPVIAWDDRPVTMSADDVLAAEAQTKQSGSAKDDAADWLAGMLADGPVKTKALESEAKAAGFSWATIRRAKDAIGARAVRIGFGPDGEWAWQLTAPIDAHDPTTESVSAYGESERLWADDPENADSAQPKDAQIPIDAHPETVSAFDENERLWTGEPESGEPDGGDSDGRVAWARR